MESSSGLIRNPDFKVIFDESQDYTQNARNMENGYKIRKVVSINLRRLYVRDVHYLELEVSVSFYL